MAKIAQTGESVIHLGMIMLNLKNTYGRFFCGFIV